jgi:hypothetical protein
MLVYKLWTLIWPFKIILLRKFRPKLFHKIDFSLRAMFAARCEEYATQVSSGLKTFNFSKKLKFGYFWHSCSKMLQSGFLRLFCIATYCVHAHTYVCTYVECNARLHLPRTITYIFDDQNVFLTLITTSFTYILLQWIWLKMKRRHQTFDILELLEGFETLIYCYGGKGENLISAACFCKWTLSSLSINLSYYLFHNPW